MIENEILRVDRRTTAGKSGAIRERAVGATFMSCLRIHHRGDEQDASELVVAK
jgi:hypothetical protein